MLRMPVALFVAALLAGVPAVSWADAPVGVAGAVNPQADSTPPGGQTRTVMVGSQMLTNERVVTGPQGSTQLIFTDHSTLTIGPSSEVVIDQFVYNPADSSGKMAVSLGRGVMRFVGGELSHKGNASVTTPSATVGIRGGIVMIRATGQETSVINLFGTSDVTSTRCSNGQQCTVSIQRPGFGTTVASSTPSSPAMVPADQVMTLTAQLQSSPGQNGGSTNPPSDANTQASGTGQSSGNLSARNTQPQAPQGGGSTPPGPNSGFGDTSTLLSGNGNVGDTSRQQEIAMMAMPSSGGPDYSFLPLAQFGDLRTVTGPTTFTYNQSNVAITYNGVIVGSYNFDMTIHLGPPDQRSLVTNALVNVTGSAWPYAHVVNFSEQISLPAPDFQLGDGATPDNVIGIGIAPVCASGVSCAFGFGLRTDGTKIAAYADHNVIVYQTPPSNCAGDACNSPPPNTPGTGYGHGFAPRVVH